MIRADQIPPEVAKLIRDKIHHGVPAERAVAEGLAAWPLAEHHQGVDIPPDDYCAPFIVLPIPQEGRDD